MLSLSSAGTSPETSQLTQGIPGPCRAARGRPPPAFQPPPRPSAPYHIGYDMLSRCHHRGGMMGPGPADSPPGGEPRTGYYYLVWSRRRLRFSCSVLAAGV
eukprot:765802-Hanusia_phi.AAC.8